MTAKQLIAELAKFPPDAPVVTSGDDMGNGRGEVYGLSLETDPGTIVLLWPDPEHVWRKLDD
jgi:hypothetical protein